MDELRNISSKLIFYSPLVANLSMSHKIIFKSLKQYEYEFVSVKCKQNFWFSLVWIQKSNNTVACFSLFSQKYFVTISTNFHSTLVKLRSHTPNKYALQSAFQNSNYVGNRIFVVHRVGTNSANTYRDKQVFGRLLCISQFSKAIETESFLFYLV